MAERDERQFVADMVKTTEQQVDRAARSIPRIKLETLPLTRQTNEPSILGAFLTRNATCRAARNPGLGEPEPRTRDRAHPLATI